MRAKHPTADLTPRPRAIHIPHQESIDPDDAQPSTSSRVVMADSNNIKPRPQQLAIANYY